MSPNEALLEKFTELKRESQVLATAIEHAEGVLQTEVEKSLFQDSSILRTKLVAIMGLGVFLNDVQTCRRRARELSASVPGVNGLPSSMQPMATELTHLFLEQGESAKQIEQQTWDLASSYLRRAIAAEQAAHPDHSPTIASAGSGSGS